VVTLVWFISIPIFIAAVAKVGWKSLPRWHRWYAMIAVPVALMVWLLIDRNVPVPIPAAIAAPFGAVLFVAWMVVVYWGIAVGVSQLVHFYRGRHGAAPSGMQLAPAASLPSVVQCWSCKAPLSVTEENRGQNIKCSRCGTKQRLPA
jgi:hypothetical protein